jgi:hypothetical protein
MTDRSNRLGTIQVCHMKWLIYLSEVVRLLDSSLRRWIAADGLQMARLHKNWRDKTAICYPQKQEPEPGPESSTPIPLAGYIAAQSFQQRDST